MTNIFRVNSVLADKVLVSRESARMLEGPLRELMMSLMAPGNSLPSPPTVVDFEGVEGVAPSFLDELLTIFESLLGAKPKREERCLIVANPPTRLSLKFEAVARGHSMSVKPISDKQWLLSDTSISSE